VEVKDLGIPSKQSYIDILVVLNASLPLSDSRRSTVPNPPITAAALQSFQSDGQLLLVPLAVCGTVLVLLAIGSILLGVYCCRLRYAKKQFKKQNGLQGSQLLQQPSLLALDQHQYLGHELEQLCRCKSLPAVDWAARDSMMMQMRCCSNDRIYRPKPRSRHGNSCYTIDLSDGSQRGGGTGGGVAGGVAGGGMRDEDCDVTMGRGSNVCDVVRGCGHDRRLLERLVRSGARGVSVSLHLFTSWGGRGSGG